MHTPGLDELTHRRAADCCHHRTVDSLPLRLLHLLTVGRQIGEKNAVGGKDEDKDGERRAAVVKRMAEGMVVMAGVRREAVAAWRGAERQG